MSGSLAAAANPSASGRGLLYDRIMRIPVLAYSCAVLGHDILNFHMQTATGAAAFVWSRTAFVAALARSSQWLFIGLLGVLPVIRLRPLGRSERLWPRALALATVGLMPAFTLLDRAPPNLACDAASVVLGLTANVMAVVTLTFLGRSLSVMPEARRLVTDGPYALVRHPLYVCELVGVTAMLLQYRSAAAIGLFVVIVVAQLIRAHAEEAVLARAFPAFASYRARTPFLLPRDPARFVTTFLLDPAARGRSLLTLAGMVFAAAVALTVLPHFVR